MAGIEKYWKSVINTLRDGLLVIDPSGIVIAVNSAAEKITGYTTDELIGRSCRILNCTGCEIFGKGRSGQWCSLFRYGNVRDKKCLITRKDNHTVDIMKSASVLIDEDGSVMGAVETLTDISEAVQKENEIMSLRRACRLDTGFHGLLGESNPMLRLFELIDNVAKTHTPVMIQGPSGTGKELVARAIHESSYRRAHPYIQVNCSALNENLLESELFGHVKGSFTGAERDRVGRFEAAHGGTIFLDEIGDIAPAIQTKLLRVLEEKQIERVGDHKPVPVDVRLITATNKHLESLVAAGHFREDLFFRINVFPIECPPVSERRDDIPLIVAEFIRQEAEKSGKDIRGVTPDAMEKLMTYSWPGNVREIRNAIEYAFVLCAEGLIRKKHLPSKIIHAENERPEKRDMQPNTVRQDTIKALKACNGNQSRAAELLGVSRVTVWSRIKKLNIDLKSL
jgi:two-component system response regulator HydG